MPPVISFIDTQVDRVCHRIWGMDGSQELGRECNFHHCTNNTRTYGGLPRMIDLPDWKATAAMFPALASVPFGSEKKVIILGNLQWKC